MAVFHWAITNMQGELEGEHATLKESNDKNAFDRVVVPGGFMKVRLTYDEFQDLSLSFDDNDKLYAKAAEPVPITSAIRDLSVEEKQAIKDRRPEWFRETVQKDGRIKHKKKDGSEFEKKQDGTLIVWKEKL